MPQLLSMNIHKNWAIDLPYQFQDDGLNCDECYQLQLNEYCLTLINFPPCSSNLRLSHSKSKNVTGWTVMNIATCSLTHIGLTVPNFPPCSSNLRLSHTESKNVFGWIVMNFATYSLTHIGLTVINFPLCSSNLRLSHAKSKNVMGWIVMNIVTFSLTHIGLTVPNFPPCSSNFFLSGAKSMYKSSLIHRPYRMVKLNLTPKNEVYYMLFERYLSIFSMTYIK